MSLFQQIIRQKEVEHQHVKLYYVKLLRHPPEVSQCGCKGNMAYYDSTPSCSICPVDTQSTMGGSHHHERCTPQAAAAWGWDYPSQFLSLVPLVLDGQPSAACPGVLLVLEGDHELGKLEEE